jgi:hypothetical protein
MLGLLIFFNAVSFLLWRFYTHSSLIPLYLAVGVLIFNLLLTFFVRFEKLYIQILIAGAFVVTLIVFILYFASVIGVY